MTVTRNTIASMLQFKEPFMLPYLFELVLRALTAVADPNCNPHFVYVHNVHLQLHQSIFPLATAPGPLRKELKNLHMQSEIINTYNTEAQFYYH